MATTVLAVGLLAACSGGGGRVSAAPLPTAASGELVCDMIPKTSVTTLLGDTKYDLTGGGPHKIRELLNWADCKVANPADPSEVYISAHMTVGKDTNISKDSRVQTAGAAVSDLGEGFVEESSQSSAWAGVVRGQRTYTVEIREVTDKRSAGADAAALLHQIVAVLDPVK